MGKIIQKIGDQGRKLRQNIFVIRQLVERDKKRSLSSTFMGELWEILNPLINMIVMVLIFGQMFGRGMSGKFPLYVLTGTTIYGLFTSGTTMCLNALMENKNFLIKTQLNKNVYVDQKIWLAFRNFLFSLLIYAFVLAVYKISPGITWLIIIPDIVLLLIMMVGIGKLLAIINVTFADITYFYKIFTLMLMYGSALFYKVDRLNPIMQKCMLVNPIYISIEIARNCMMYYQTSDRGMWLILLGYAGGCYVLGTVLYQKKIENIVAQL